MKAMILAAGLGTRLRPLTDNRPKALVEVNGRTLLEITLSRLRTFGVREAIVNVHHFADMVVAYLKANDNFGMHIEVSREEDLLDTEMCIRDSSSVVASIAIRWPFSSPRSASTPSTQVNTSRCVSTSISRRVREIVE